MTIRKASTSHTKFKNIIFNFLQNLRKWAFTIWNSLAKTITMPKRVLRTTKSQSLSAKIIKIWLQYKWVSGKKPKRLQTNLANYKNWSILQAIWKFKKTTQRKYYLRGHIIGLTTVINPKTQIQKSTNKNSRRTAILLLKVSLCTIKLSFLCVKLHLHINSSSCWFIKSSFSKRKYFWLLRLNTTQYSMWAHS